MDTSLLSNRFFVRQLTERDIAAIYSLCSGNPLYYEHCPPLVTRQSIADDLKALPPGKTPEDKFYLGYYDGDRLVAVLDLIWSYPDEQRVLIGFFMVEASVQKSGVGSMIVDELWAFLKAEGILGVRLSWVMGNPQAEHFWHKNGFREAGSPTKNEHATFVVAERIL